MRNLAVIVLQIVAIAVCVSMPSLAGAREEKKFYKPLEKNIEGWTIVYDPRLDEEENKEVADKAFKALANHLQRITYTMPEPRLKELRKLRIWVDLDHKLGNMQYHPNRKWLVDNGHDPALVKHVHVPRASSLYGRRNWIKQPYVILHELAHAYHDQVLDFNNKEILDAYKAAKKKGIYEKSLLYNGSYVRHYGLTDQKEYFAESTESYFGTNDFYPFVRAELKEHDPAMYEIMKKVWGEIR